MSSSPQEIFALLIGIDNYDSPRINNLKGCVQDVRDMLEWLQSCLDVPPSHIHLLISPNLSPASDPLTEPLCRLPTRQNIIEELDWLDKNAMKGSSVFIHYSGHGGRFPTLYPALKEVTKIDEALIPQDYPEAGPIRDVEFGRILDAIVKKSQLVLFAVLDCCHSAGAVRGHNKGGDSNDGAVRTCELEGVQKRTHN